MGRELGKGECRVCTIWQGDGVATIGRAMSDDHVGVRPHTHGNGFVYQGLAVWGGGGDAPINERPVEVAYGEGVVGVLELELYHPPPVGMDARQFAFRRRMMLAMGPVEFGGRDDPFCPPVDMPPCAGVRRVYGIACGLERGICRVTVLPGWVMSVRW
jgi:hypothetical protein